MKRRNKFSLSHFKLLTGKMGYLYPIACVETLPGDTFQMATSVFLRFSPMVAPVMTPVTVKIHHWFVPTRLIWDEFEDFITGGPQGTSVPVPPHFQYSGAHAMSEGNLLDYFGVPPFNVGDLGDSSSKINISSLPSRAYRLIYNEWYRDQNLQEELVFPTTSGMDVSANFPNANVLMRAPWDKDYFTTASPTEQKGIAVNVPINLTTDGGTPLITGTITGNGVPQFTALGQTGPLNRIREYDGGNETNYFTTNVRHGSETNIDGSADLAWSDPNLSVNLQWNGDTNTQGGLNLNAFREAMAMQRFEEHRQLFGSRYVEYLRYLGVKASDARLQRPEYLGGGRSVIQFSEVLQTAEGTDPVGTMRGHGIGAMRTNRFRRFFEEHGYVITLLSIRPKAIYTQGLPRMFSREIKTDYWQKELEHIGQQEVKNKEVFMAQSNHEGTFGYSDRYNEYRNVWSSVHGEFRSLLNYWHLGREFSSAPTLNGDFVSSLPSDRIFADQTGNDTIYMMVNNSIQARRLVSKHGNPR